MTDRIIIGGSEIAGLIISAPLEKDKEILHEISDIRWIQREGSFSLQYYAGGGLGWRDVPVVKEGK